MKLGIMSDSHDNMPKISSAVDVFNREQVDLVVHAGDFVAPFTGKPLDKLDMPFVAVFGNNDGEVLGLAKRFEGKIHKAPHQLVFGEKKLLVCHEPIALSMLKTGTAFDAIIYGHTHQIDIQKSNTLIINPGETCGWLSGRCTVAVWDVSQNEIRIIDI